MELAILGFHTRIESWITAKEGQLSNGLDSVSQTSRRLRNSHLSTKTRSNRSPESCDNASSINSAHIQGKSKLAALIAHKTFAEKQAALEKEQLQLKSKRELMKIEDEIEMARERDSVLQQAIQYRPKSTSSQLDPSVLPFVPQNLSNVPKSTTMSHSVRAYDVPMPNYFHSQQLAAALVLPHAEVEKFKRDPLDFATFMMAFKARILPYTNSDSDRMYYLHQHLEKHVQDDIDRCMFMSPEEGYKEAMSILKKEYGDSY
ncbi:uncharacterized protein [Palaemon carinicauda]|uniref:uncharacterized protein n=1 Tax=Palaemon carinicauda TaxID=392227 RepID=UPI0035B5896D